MIGYEVISKSESMDPVFSSVHTTWFVKTDHGYLYVSHQSHLPYAGPECMAFACDENGAAIDYNELAVSYRRDADEAFREVMEELMGE